MEQYINKSALVAEIDRRVADNKKEIERASHKNLEDYFEGYEDALVLFKEKFIDTLEVKEVDLDKEAELIANSIMIPVQANLYHTNIYNFEKRCFKHSDLKEAAKKGIELGLKAQKKNSYEKDLSKNR